MFNVISFFGCKETTFMLQNDYNIVSILFPEIIDTLYLIQLSIVKVRPILIFYNTGLIRRTTDSLNFSQVGRLRHTDGLIRWQFSRSLKNISFISIAFSLSYINAFPSKLCSKLRKSRLVEPMVKNSSSDTMVFA